MVKEWKSYYWTLKYLKKSQLFYLVKNRLERNRRAVTEAVSPETDSLHLWIEALDAHPEYLKRFPVEDTIQGQVVLLHERGKIGGRNWQNSSRPHLWNFNLHYLEYLIPLAAAYRREKEITYYECFQRICRQWIRENQDGTGDGWHPYTISLRLTNLWICMDGFGELFETDTEFGRELRNSMYAQYLHLLKRPELHLLGNHYFENLKAVLLGALYFQEPKTYERYKKKLLKEIEEQILPDGVHYERSLMYHKIIMEDLMRLAAAVQNVDTYLYKRLTVVLGRMADALLALEDKMGHTILFNDAGDNTARPFDSLMDAWRTTFETEPDQKEKRAFPDAGYYCLGNDRIRIILDAGEIAPSYMPGHGHCDALSFELSLDGKPLFVNSGTGQYQGALRAYFRSTRAHNTVVIDGEEQSICWGEHRVGRRIRSVSGYLGTCWVGGKLTTCTGKRHFRRIGLRENQIVIRDRIKGHGAAYFHLAPGYAYVCRGQEILVTGSGNQKICRIQFVAEDQIQIHKEGEICSYAPEFGLVEQIQVLEVQWNSDWTEHEIKVFINPKEDI